MRALQMKNFPSEQPHNMHLEPYVHKDDTPSTYTAVSRAHQYA